MNILWMSDFSVNENSGGAQRTDDFIINFGKFLGHNIDHFIHNSELNIIKNKEYDMIVTGYMRNLLSRPDSQVIWDFVTSHKNHVKFEHDSGDYLNPERRIVLHGSAKKRIFLSKYHYEQYVKKYNYPISFDNVDIVPSPIDDSKFHNYNLEREDKTLYAGFIHSLKGAQNLFSEIINNPSKQFVVAGWTSHHSFEEIIYSFKNVEFIGKKSHLEMPELFNKYTELFYHPVGFEPFCRTIAEAAFCGIKLNCSNNIGAVHDINQYGIEEVKKRCKDSPKQFWELVCK
ncbi:MAG: hypothetical protein HWN81_18005 [Candidatus Lokiarchaeota archaeon]|nr:hypothetical protein [Candidatus Lokiarchaeota archaeon]